MNEQRHPFQCNTDRQILIELSDGSHVHARMINISGNGVGIIYAETADIGARLHLVLPLSYDETHVDLKLTGVVRDVHLRQGRYFIGIEFCDLTESQQLPLAKFLKFKEAHRASSPGVMASYRNSSA